MNLRTATAAAISWSLIRWSRSYATCGCSAVTIRAWSPDRYDESPEYSQTYAAYERLRTDNTFWTWVFEGMWRIERFDFPKDLEH
jgi:hypothetical protein